MYLAYKVVTPESGHIMDQALGHNGNQGRCLRTKLEVLHSLMEEVFLEDLVFLHLWARRNI